MESSDSIPKPHAVCFPFPAQSHVKAMLKLSKLLHNKGFHITFVNTEFVHHRFLASTDSLDTDSLETLGFRFQTISDPDAAQDVASLCNSTRNNFAGPFLDLLARINDAKDDVVSSSCRRFPASCLVVDGFMSFSVGSAAEELGIPLVKFFPISAIGLVGLQQFRPLLDKGIVQIKGEADRLKSILENTLVDWIPGINGLRLRDLPSTCQTATDTNDSRFKFLMDIAETAHEASAVIIQTFDALEQHMLKALRSKIPCLYSIGPLQLLLDRLPEQEPLKTVPYSLWKEETGCLKWLDTRNPNSVIYVNFGSIVTLTKQQLVEFGWGLANGNHPFLWVIRPDLVFGETACLSKEFLDEIEGRSLIISWCSQEDVLNHPSVGGFLTHCGWNSMAESISSGVPLLCYPCIADQLSNSWLACNELGVGLEINKDVKRDQVEEVVKDLMENEKGRKMKSKAMEWKKLAEEATSPHGSSSKNLDDLITQILTQKQDCWLEKYVF